MPTAATIDLESNTFPRKLLLLLADDDDADNNVKRRKTSENRRLRCHLAPANDENENENEMAMEGVARRFVVFLGIVV
jgi:hypothetical protein